MTGIGFLGAGVIFKEGLTVRGLTTAASIWITAAIGILVGIGFYFAAVVGAVATLLILSRVPLRREPAAVGILRPPHPELRARARDERGGPAALIGSHGFSIANLSLRLTDDGQHLRVPHGDPQPRPQGAAALSEHLLELPEVIEFRISPTGD